MFSRGFTLIEMMLSVTIISLIAGFSLPMYESFQNRNELDIAAQNVAQTLRRAQTYARGVHGDSQWGVAIQSNTIILFKGTSYATRDTAYDEPNAIAASTNVSGMSQVVFAKLSGAATTTGGNSISLTSNNNARTVSINAKGMVNY